MATLASEDESYVCLGTDAVSSDLRLKLLIVGGPVAIGHAAIY